jgi:SAM domain (Sterile alpha motif)
MDVADRLRALGLGQYEAAFRENAVIATLLPNLTAGDLEDLGVALVGHRHQILDAIAALRLEDTTAGGPARLSSGSPVSPTGNLGASETTAARRPSA